MDDILHIAYIGLGANLGDPILQCQEAASKMKEVAGISSVSVSSFYKTSPLVPEGQSSEGVPLYANAVARIETKLSPLALLDVLKKIEQEMGRVRSQKWESRLIDLDLLAYEDLIFSNGDLSVPHDQMHARAFVLKPLCDINSEWVHPVLKKTAGELLGGLHEKVEVWE